MKTCYECKKPDLSKHQWCSGAMTVDHRFYRCQCPCPGSKFKQNPVGFDYRYTETGMRGGDIYPEFGVVEQGLNEVQRAWKLQGDREKHYPCRAWYCYRVYSNKNQRRWHEQNHPGRRKAIEVWKPLLKWVPIQGVVERGPAGGPKPKKQFPCRKGCDRVFSWSWHRDKHESSKAHDEATIDTVFDHPEVLKIPVRPREEKISRRVDVNEQVRSGACPVCGEGNLTIECDYCSALVCEDCARMTKVGVVCSFHIERREIVL